MTHEGPSVASALRGRVPTGYGRLDEALQGGFLAGSAILLSAPASGEVPILVRNFLKASNEVGLLICRSQSSAEAVSQPDDTNLKCMICSEKPISPSRNFLPGKGIDNLTELNFQITETIGSVQPKRIVVEILSDILLRHKALQTRKWLNEFLEKLRPKGITTLAVLNPYMHASEEVQAVIDLFDGNIEMVEREIEGQLQKLLRIKWMKGIDAAEKDLPLLDLAQERLDVPQHPAVVTPLKEPRWLTALVGRTVEISKLKTAFEKALANRSSVVALQGEAGVGKTRLMQELAVYAQSKGTAALTGNASESGLPYAPWIEIARQYIGQAPGELLRRILGPYLSEFARLVPDIVVKLGTIPPSKPLGEQQDKIRLYEAVTQFFISICSESPLLLLFDDMQSADQPSLELLEYFIRSTSNFRVLTACSYRSEDFQSTSSLYQMLMKFNRQRLLETIQVKNLSKEETTELIKQTFEEQTVSPEFADLVYQRTGGNPFFVEEVLRSLVEDGIVFRTEKKWDRKPIQEIVLPESVKSVLKSRLTRLQPEALNLLTMASVIGSEFDFEVLREVTQTPEDTLLERLEEGITAGLISELPSRKDVFRFADNRIRELLLRDLIRSRRIRYHVKIAEAMEKTYSKNLENQAGAIATHFSEGGDTERTVKYSLMAGDRNRTIHAYDQAISDYKRAVDLIDLEGNKEREKEPFLEKLAECHFFAGEYENAIQAYQQALAILEKSSDRKGYARICLALGRTYTRAEVGALQGFTKAKQILNDGLTFLGEETESFEAASFYARLAHLHSFMDEWDEALTWTEKATEVGNKTGNYSAVARALATKASFLTDTGKIDEGLPLWQQALDLAVKHEEYDAICFCLSNLAFITYPRSLAKAREFAVRHQEHHKRANDIAGEAGAFDLLARVDFLLGDWAKALEEENKAVKIMKKLGLASSLEADSREGWTWLMVGNLQKAEEHFQNASSLLTEGSKITEIVEVHLGLALLSLEQGREDEAKAHLETCVNAFKKWEYTTLPIYHIQTLLHLTSIYAKEKEIEKARESSQWAKRLAETLKSDAGLAMTSQAEASLLLAMGDRKGAEEAYLKCFGLWEKASWPYYHAKALVEYSEAIADSKLDESKKRLEKAVEIFMKLGAKRDLERAQATLSAMKK